MHFVNIDANITEVSISTTSLPIQPGTWMQFPTWNSNHRMSLSERFQSIRSNPRQEERTERRSVVQSSPSNTRQVNKRNVASDDFRGGRNNATREGGIQKSRGARQGDRQQSGGRDRNVAQQRNTPPKRNANQAQNGNRGKAKGGKPNANGQFKKKATAGKPQKSKCSLRCASVLVTAPWTWSQLKSRLASSRPFISVLRDGVRWFCWPLTSLKACSLAWIQVELFNDEICVSCWFDNIDFYSCVYSCIV
jgi:hypothetical protein